MLLLGTTDSPHEGDPAEVAVGPGDGKQILAEAAVALDADLVAPDRVRAAYAGLRVLPAGDGEGVSARRETVFTRSKGGMLNVAGGKLTTYRRIALESLARLQFELGLHRLDSLPWPLPGATGLDRVSLPSHLEPEVALASAVRKPGARGLRTGQGRPCPPRTAAPRRPRHRSAGSLRDNARVGAKRG
jgi:glycerol-3-phosphate dehydrogenase